MKRVVIFGAGGHAKVVADILLALGTTEERGYDVLGFLDDRPEMHGHSILGLRVLGGRNYLDQARKGGLGVALGIGVNNVARQAAAHFAMSCGAELITAVHPRAVVAHSAELGPGTVVMAGAIINPDARVGVGVVINTGSVIEHDVVLEDYCFVAPGAVVTGGSRIGSLTLVGAGATIIPEITVGSNVIIGAGSVVVEDVPDGVTVTGVPARIRRAASATP